jgi:hypothetical protein
MREQLTQKSTLKETVYGKISMEIINFITRKFGNDKDFKKPRTPQRMLKKDCSRQTTPI